MSARIAYLSGRTYRGEAMPPGEVPPLERISRDLIFSAGLERGLEFEVAYWDDPELAHRSFDGAIIRTCWDYHERPDHFIASLQALEQSGLPVFNRSEAVRWNVRKTYLKDLGALAIDTIWVERADAVAVAQAFDALDAAELVVKPQVGAGSRETVRLRRNAWSDADLIAAPRGPAMIQTFLRSIESEGERSLFWFGGAYSHAVRKTPHRGDWLANMPGRTAFFADPPPPRAMETAEAARARAPSDLLYARIDLVLGDDGQWRVIEIEAIEPYLFLDFAPEGAGRFADAIVRVLSL